MTIALVYTPRLPDREPDSLKALSMVNDSRNKEAK